MYMREIIKEQFNISNMDFNNNHDHNKNIFNKNIIDPYTVYNKILHGEDVYKNEIKELNSDICISSFKPENHAGLLKIIEF